MAKRFRTWAALAVLTLAGTTGSASSPAAAAEAGPPEAGAAAPIAATPTETDAEPPKPPNPLARHLDIARELAGQLRLRSDQVQDWLRAARRARYRERTGCLNDLLSQTHAVEREADAAQRNAEKAVEQSDAHGVLRELVHLYVYDQRSRTLLDQAQWCGVARRRLAPGRAAGPREAAQPAGRTGYAEPGNRRLSVR